MMPVLIVRIKYVAIYILWFTQIMSYFIPLQLSLLHRSPVLLVKLFVSLMSSTMTCFSNPFSSDRFISTCWDDSFTFTIILLTSSPCKYTNKSRYACTYMVYVYMYYAYMYVYYLCNNAHVSLVIIIKKRKH